MADMLVKLYNLPEESTMRRQLPPGVFIRRAMAYEQEQVVAWVSSCFNDLWAQECRTAFGRLPVGCYVAVDGSGILGFCCLDTTFNNFVGPIGVAQGVRTNGIGRALLFACLSEQKSRGFAYAVIGDAGQPAFFESAVGALVIEGSKPGPYPPRLPQSCDQ